MSVLPRPLLLALPLLVLLPTGCDPSTRHETLKFDEPEILALALDTDSGDVTIVGDPQAESITVHAEIHGSSTELRHAIVEGVLELAADCPTDTWTCSIDWTITVPVALPARVSTGSGDLEARFLVAKLSLSTGSGDVTLADLTSPTLDVETGSGDVTGTAVACDDFAGSAGSGDLELSLAIRPRRIAWDSGSGDVELTLPSGGYDLEIETGSGDVELSGVIDDPDSDALLSLTTGSGDVAVRGR